MTLLINGLPMIQIELKAEGHSAREALNQMHQYIDERQYTDIYATLQLLVAMTPRDIRYMANTTSKMFNKDFAFQWQDNATNKAVFGWQDFINQVLSIPMAHELATRYMILDGTANKQMLKVMRPYQVYATKALLDKARTYDFDLGVGKLGYVWHTTGSGKTITSFKSAWLASRLPNIDKVIFLVDRIALTNQTVEAYKAYDPVEHDGKTGVVAETANISDLHRKLHARSDKNIIVTSIQKMSRYVESGHFQATKQSVLFIVDEAHRSTSGDTDSMLQQIRQKMPRSAWVGYTGTPRFPQTKQLFGEKLHAYTILEAIADKNVLGFKVDFEDTLDPETIKAPTEAELNEKRLSVYDTSAEHLKVVAENIFTHWRVRSNNRRYNGLFTVKVGGGRASTPRALEYFQEFQRLNREAVAAGKAADCLRVAVTFAADNSNGENMTATNGGLSAAIAHYNAEFGTVFDMSTVREYTEDVARRLNKTSDDGQYLDLVIVVDQFLTGFDAPELNTLYVDRILRGASLIQAYSRTNRIHNREEKPWGRVVNYRWPHENEAAMNEALYIYSNKENDSELELPGLEEIKAANEKSAVVAPPFDVVLARFQEVWSTAMELTCDATEMPPGKNAQQQLLAVMGEYNRLVNQLKQYDRDELGNVNASVYDESGAFYDLVGVNPEKEAVLLGAIVPEVKETVAKRKQIDVSEIDVELRHIAEVEIDYDYLTELLADLADLANAKKSAAADQKYEEIVIEVAKSEDEQEAREVLVFADMLRRGTYKFESYPAPRGKDLMRKHMIIARDGVKLAIVREFVSYWGLDSAVNLGEFMELLAGHTVGKRDLDKKQQLSSLALAAKEYYRDYASPEVQQLSWVRYRNGLSAAVYELADRLKRGL